MKSARAAGTSRSSGLSFRICLLTKSTIGEILSQMTVMEKAGGETKEVKSMSYMMEEALLHWA